jgi:hypothetical protein
MTQKCVCSYKSVDKLQALTVDELNGTTDIGSLSYLLRMILPLTIPEVSHNRVVFCETAWVQDAKYGDNLIDGKFATNAGCRAVYQADGSVHLIHERLCETCRPDHHASHMPTFSLRIPQVQLRTAQWPRIQVHVRQHNL